MISKLDYKVKQKKYLVWIEKLIYIDTTKLQRVKLENEKMFNWLFLNKRKKIQYHIYEKAQSHI